jgi:hypothetical protein
LGLSSVVDFLNNREAKGTTTGNLHLANFIRKADQTLTAAYATILMLLELKKEVLEFQKKCIEVKLREHNIQISLKKPERIVLGFVFVLILWYATSSIVSLFFDDFFNCLGTVFCTPQQINALR